MIVIEKNNKDNDNAARPAIIGFNSLIEKGCILHR